MDFVPGICHPLPPPHSPDVSVCVCTSKHSWYIFNNSSIGKKRREIQILCSMKYWKHIYFLFLCYPWKLVFSNIHFVGPWNPFYSDFIIFHLFCFFFPSFGFPWKRMFASFIFFFLVILCSLWWKFSIKQKYGRISYSK